MEENRLKRCLKGVKVTEGGFSHSGGGLDLSECDIVHLQLVTKRKNGQRKKK